MAKRSSATSAIKATKNYRLFTRSVENRPFDMKKHKKLKESMKLYGFLRCYPIVCCRNSKKHLVVKDGQHRLAIAEELGLPVYWIDELVDFDIATVNSTPKTWTLKDFAQKHAANGLRPYQEGLDFAGQHGLPTGTAFALLSGTTTYNNVANAFVGGTWKVKDRAWADAVAGIYVPLVTMAKCLRNARFIEACMGVCRVEQFKAARLLRSAARCREKLVAYSTKDAYLDMLESIYNFGHSRLLGLKAAATEAMRKRNIATQAKAKSKK